MLHKEIVHNRYKLIISYDGTTFHGFQRQSKLISVQGTIEEALKLIFKEEVLIKGAGRTDAKVHALNQYAHFDSDIYIPPKSLKKVLNKRVSPYIYIKDVELTDESFHARISAKKKEYRYIISLNEYDPLKANYCYFYPYQLDIEKIKSFVKNLLNVRSHIDKMYYSKKRSKYNKELIDPKFIKWQMKVLEKIYGPLIEKKRTQGWDINFTELEIDGIKQKYESITLNMQTVNYPFSGICDKQNLETKVDICKPKYSEIVKKHSKFVKKYYRLIKSTIRYPRRLGYMLEEIHTNKEGKWWISAYTGTYENNIKTSHILEYELYRYYKKAKNTNISEMKGEELLKKLPMRYAIHQKFKECGDESDVLVSGKYRESLLSVQVFCFSS